MSEWKDWSLLNLKDEKNSSIIKVKFADGLFWVEDTLYNWINVEYHSSPITHYKVVT